MWDQIQCLVGARLQRRQDKAIWRFGRGLEEHVLDDKTMNSMLETLN
jgi:hypothetical protein